MTERRPPSLTEGSISRGLFFFALPVLFGNVLQSINVSVNAIWIGRYLGEAALTASSNVSAILFLLIGVMFGISLATTILVAQSVGAKNLDQAKRVVGTSATFFAAASTLMAIVGILIAPWLLHWMNMPAAALPFATAYLRVILLGIPFLYMYAFVTMTLRGAGDSKTPFYFLFLSVSLDIALNPLFMFGWGPVPKMGIAGSATATLIAQGTAFTALMIYLYRKKHFLRIQRHELHYLKIDPVILRALIAKGIPMGLQIIVLSGATLAMITLVNPFGTQTTAAYGACNQLWNYLQMPAVAVGQAVSSMAAQNVGARLWDRINRIALSGVAFNFAMSGTLIAVLLIFDKQLLGLFLNDPRSVEIGRHIDVLVVWSFAVFGVTMVLSGVVRSTGAVIPPLLILFFTLWVIRVPFARFFAARFGADALWYSFPISSFVALVCSVGYYRFGKWKSASMLKNPSPAAKPAEPAEA
jgi:putative MATE family efflux protein